MKGQTAVEYLMTYGWAILIILIVAGVLAYYGIFALKGFLGDTSQTIILEYQIKCYKVTIDGKSNITECYNQLCVDKGIFIDCYNTTRYMPTEYELKVMK